MRKIREVLRLKFECGLSNRAVAASCHLSPSTVFEYVRRAAAAGLKWPLSEDLNDEVLQERMFGSGALPPGLKRPLPEWSEIHREMQRKGVTLFLLWQEYKSAHPQGHQYSQFCERYRQWLKTRDVCLRQEYKAGEKMFVDWAGQNLELIDPSNGQVRAVQIFVAVLGASNYTYVRATLSQALPDWIASHMGAWEAFGGVSETVVPDNTRTAVSAPSYYDPDLNPTYLELARHYGTAILPARVRHPRDKAKVETAVQIVERRILAPLRDRKFFSLDELNRALREKNEELNAQAFQKMPGSRRVLFETMERPALRALPTQRYEFAQWKKAKVHVDYHVQVEGHFYSVPYRLVGQSVDVRVSGTSVECFYKGQRVGAHVRVFRKGAHTTLKEHMPASHREYLDWTPQRLVNWAAKIGPFTARMVERILGRQGHPVQGYRSCFGLIRLGKIYGDQRLEAACQRGLSIGADRYRSIESILRSGLDRQGSLEPVSERPMRNHENVRGAGYYGEQTHPAPSFRHRASPEESLRSQDDPPQDRGNGNEESFFVPHEQEALNAEALGMGRKLYDQENEQSCEPNQTEVCLC